MGRPLPPDADEGRVQTAGLARAVRLCRHSRLIAALGRCRALAACGLIILSAPGASLAQVVPPDTVRIPSGQFIMGSDRAERDAAYALDSAAYRHTATRDQRWYENESARHAETLPAFDIMRTPVTNRRYRDFVRATGHRAPNVGRATWNGYRLIHPYSRTRKHQWRGDEFPAGRGEHPVVLVSRADAEAYARWLSVSTGGRWRLPTEAEWERAARGNDGRRFPWGDEFDKSRLNSHDAGPFDTVPVGAYPSGASPFGMLDAAGNVFEWTSTPDGSGRSIVKGGSWDDKGCGVCRPAARHGRPDGIKHILVGFRLVRELP